MPHRQPESLFGAPCVYATAMVMNTGCFPYQRKEFQTNMVKSERLLHPPPPTWLFTPPSKRRLSCQNVGLGPDWSFEWIYTCLISATANRHGSKQSRENRGRRGVSRL